MAFPPTYIVGLDLGQSNDPTALIVTELTTPSPGSDQHHYDVRHIERMPLNTRYPAVVSRACGVVSAIREQPSKPPVYLAIDYTGCGRPVADLLIQAQPAVQNLGLVTITGGDSVTLDPAGGFRVPKRDLASVIQVLLQSGRLRIADSLPMASELTKELMGFRVKISLTGHDSYGAGEDWRSAPHDDLVLALAMACWYGENRIVTGPLVANDYGDDDW